MAVQKQKFFKKDCKLSQIQKFLLEGQDIEKYYSKKQLKNFKKYSFNKE